MYLQKYIDTQLHGYLVILMMRMRKMAQNISFLDAINHEAHAQALANTHCHNCLATWQGYIALDTLRPS